MLGSLLCYPLTMIPCDDHLYGMQLLLNSLEARLRREDEGVFSIVRLLQDSSRASSSRLD
jgi:hypothetical protein